MNKFVNDPTLVKNRSFLNIHNMEGNITQREHGVDQTYDFNSEGGWGALPGMPGNKECHLPLQFHRDQAICHHGWSPHPQWHTLRGFRTEQNQITGPG